MVNDVFPTIIQLFNNVLVLFERVFSSLGAWAIFISGFVVFTLYRLLLRPIMGAAVSIGASDTVKKVRMENKKNNKKGN